MRIPFMAGADDHDRRLESVLRRLLPHQTLGNLHKALRQGDIRLRGAKAGPDSRVQSGDEIAVWSALVAAPPPLNGPRPGFIPADFSAEWVLYEGTDLLVVNKPSGLLVHRGDDSQGNTEVPLDERVRVWLQPTQKVSLSFRPGPLHRLDKETSGLVVFSRTLVGARIFSEALANHGVRKTYLAVLTGNLREPREVKGELTRDTDTKISRIANQGEGQEAFSWFSPLAHTAGLTLAEVDLGTGRTHQIRVHAQSLGFPLAGDKKYGGGPTPPGLDVPWLLHAWKLSCDLLPELKAPLPAERTSWLEKTFKIRP